MGGVATLDMLCPSLRKNLPVGNHYPTGAYCTKSRPASQAIFSAGGKKVKACGRCPGVAAHLPECSLARGRVSRYKGAWSTRSATDRRGKVGKKPSMKIGEWRRWWNWVGWRFHFLRSKWHQPVAAERRQANRYPCRLRVACYPAAPSSGRPLAARSRDLSQTGIGMVVKGVVAPGTLLEVRMQKGQVIQTRLLLVAHQRAEPKGRWFVGGAFYRELTEEQLRALRP